MLISKLFFFFFCCTTQHVGSQFPNQGLNLCPLHWKHRVLTTGPPEKSPSKHILKGSVKRIASFTMFSVYLLYIRKPLIVVDFCQCVDSGNLNYFQQFSVGGGDSKLQCVEHGLWSRPVRRTYISSRDLCETVRANSIFPE